jgi:WD40 repeat protein
LAVSGYGRRPQDFAELVRILDTEFRLITPINRGDSEEPEPDRGQVEFSRAADKERSEVTSADSHRTEPLNNDCHYQLAHDYLVHSVRDWLGRKQRETQSGRAELLLAERAAYWDQTRDAKFFPGWIDWARISFLTKRGNWTESQRRMMGAAGKQHLVRFAAVLSVMATIMFGALSLVRSKHAESQRAMWAEEDLQRNLYFAEMNLASQASTLPNAVRDYLMRWTPERAGVDLRGWEWYYLRSRIRRGRVAIENLGGRARNVVWNRDGTRVAVSAEGHGVIIWDFQTGEELHTINAESVWSFDWSPDGRWLAVAQLYGSITVWDGESFELSRTLLKTASDSVPSVSWSPDSKRLAAGFFESGKIRIWDMDSGEENTSITTGSRQMRQVAWSPDGRSLASTDNEKFIKVWEANTGNQLFEINNQTIPDQSVNTWTLCWSPDGSQIATGSTDGVIRVWDLAKKKAIAPLKSNSGVVVCVAWHPKLPQLVSGHEDHCVRVWNLNNSKPTREFRGHNAQVRRAVWNPEGTQLASAGYDGSLRIWDVNEDDQNQLLHCRERVETMDWDPVSSQLASGGNGIDAFVWDTHSGTRMDVPLRIRGNLALRSLRWSPDGNFLAAAKVKSQNEKGIQVWNKETGEVRELEWNAGSVNRLSWNTDGSRLAAGATNGELAILDVDKLETLESLAAHKGNINQVQWNPTETLLASGGVDGHVRVWSPDPLTLVWQWKRPAGSVKSLSWSPDGTQIAAVGDNGIIAILNGKTGLEIKAFGEQTEANQCVAWSPDGKRIVTGSVYGILRIWDIATGKMTISLKDHIQNCYEVCWHPEGRKIAACGTYGSDTGGVIQIWDATLGYVEPASSTR